MFASASNVLIFERNKNSKIHFLFCVCSICSIAPPTCPEGTLNCPCKATAVDQCVSGLTCNQARNLCQMQLTPAPVNCDECLFFFFLKKNQLFNLLVFFFKKKLLLLLIDTTTNAIPNASTTRPDCCANSATYTWYNFSCFHFILTITKKKIGISWLYDIANAIADARRSEHELHQRRGGLRVRERR